MKSICDERDKLEELHMKVMKWATTWIRQALHSFQEYKKNREDVLQRLNWANFKLDDIFGVISRSFDVNVQIALERLIDSMENQLNTKQWEKHRKLCEFIQQILLICEDRYHGMYFNYNQKSKISRQIYARILEYLMKLIDIYICKDEKLIDSAFSALRKFPFIKYQSLLLKLIDYIGNQFNTDQCKREIQAKSCDFIIDVSHLKTKKLNQQTSNQLFDYLRKFIDRCDDDEMIDRAWIGLREFPASQISSQVYQPLLQNYLQSSQLNWKMHRNWLSINLLRRPRHHRNVFIDIFKQIENNLWFEYLRKIVRQCDHMPLVLIAILLLESMYLEGYLNIDSENIENIKNELMDRVQSLDSECPLAHSLPDDFDFDRYQVEWCARWCVHNVIGRQKRWEMGRKLPLIKLSKDRFEARNYQKLNHFIPVRSQFSVSSGVYFYEVTVVTSGKMMFGWSLYDAQFNKSHWELNEFDVSQKFCDIYSNYIMAKLFECQRSDVIGCLKDNRRFVFYCNGKEVVSVDQDKDYDNEQIIKSSSSHCYATALLSRHQHCYFNFGQASFKFPPKDIKFMDFHKASGQNERKYQLTETGKVYSNFWFKHLPVDNQVDLFYRDKRQNECDELVKRVERDIEEGREVEEMKMELGCDRYIQAIIEEMGKTIQKDKIDLMAQWVGSVIEMTIDEQSNARQLQLLYPYLHLLINSPLDYIKHRNICIVLSNLIRFSEWYDDDFIEHISNEVFTYLTRTLTETSDEWTQLFGLIALDYLKLSDDEKKNMENNNLILEFLIHYKDTSRYSDIYKMITLEHFNPLPYQLHLMSELIHNRDDYVNVLNCPTKLPQSNRSDLKIIDRSDDLKVSHDLLSIRSDWRWQWIRYDCSNEKRIFYFEVILLTNGPMRIGWSTKRTEFQNGDKLGEDEFSIVFNGHSRVMYHQNTPSSTHCIPQWKAGDVVSCLIHRETHRFYFLLNGHPLLLPDKLYFSPHLPYYPSLSLSAHQQVYYNFGQSNFRYQQPNIEHLEIELSIQKSLLGLSVKPVTSFNIHNSPITNAVLTIGSKNNFGDLTFSQKSQSVTISSLNSNPNNKRDFTTAERSCIPQLSDISQTNLHQTTQLSLRSAITGTGADEDLKQKYTILLEENILLKQRQNVLLFEENTKLKQRIAELEIKYENNTIKAEEKPDEIKSSTSTYTAEHDAQQQTVVSIEEYTRLQQRCAKLEKYVEEQKGMLSKLCNSLMNS